MFLNCSAFFALSLSLFGLNTRQSRVVISATECKNTMEQKLINTSQNIFGARSCEKLPIIIRVSRSWIEKWDENELQMDKILWFQLFPTPMESWMTKKVVRKINFFCHFLYWIKRIYYCRSLTHCFEHKYKKKIHVECFSTFILFHFTLKKFQFRNIKGILVMCSVNHIKNYANINVNCSNKLTFCSFFLFPLSLLLCLPLRVFYLYLRFTLQIDNNLMKYIIKLRIHSSLLQRFFSLSLCRRLSHHGIVNGIYRKNCFFRS